MISDVDTLIAAMVLDRRSTVEIPPIEQRGRDEGDMHNLVARAWQIYHDAKQETFVVTPSIPILYFGDSERYFASPLKVVTVGLNPSRLEFPEYDRFARFPNARTVSAGALSDEAREDYVQALNGYFRTRPYTAWFNPSFEWMLNGMNCSYYGQRENTALHTDLCSPLATDPTWSGLTKERSQLELGGSALWHDLIQYMEPDVIIVSVARHYLEQVRFVRKGPWHTVYMVDRLRPYAVELIAIEVSPSKVSHIVFGRAANQPFGTISNRDKEKAGTAIREHLHAR